MTATSEVRTSDAGTIGGAGVADGTGAAEPGTAADGTAGPAETGDIRSLLGLQTPGAVAMVAFFIVAFALVGGMTAPDGGLWAEAVAWLLVSVGAIALIRAPGDPLSLPWTVYIALAGPVATAVVLPQLSVDELMILQLWPLSATTALASYMCARGRVWAAWASLLSAIGLCVLWAVAVGEGAGYGLGVSIVKLAPLVMATFFAGTIRPAARDIFALRQASTVAVAKQAADSAVLDERDRQLLRLDARVRPLLERLAEPRPLTAADCLECGLVEAGLRDSLRARALDTPEVIDAARAARVRGVEVVLLDDHGPSGVPGPVRERIVGHVLPVLHRADQGSITIRILPPGRSVLATVLHSDGDDIERAEYDQDGRLVSPD